ncbi:hypothetical protein PIIN_01049 [Serendipita indica DSM 11827]|uniref:Uncharacterized protein n=1 Tax=Serendipita indica (strain DSM 11827) TaxID=1109443 RepID=G4T7F7_SERID|nr:hypothetical protein PIIN_01049 [Serendipita indica DSM 11827]
MNPVDLTLHDEDEKEIYSPHLERDTPDYAKLEYEMESDREDVGFVPDQTTDTRSRFPNPRRPSPPRAPRSMRNLPPPPPFDSYDSRFGGPRSRMRPHTLPEKPGFASNFPPLSSASIWPTPIRERDSSRWSVRRPEDKAPGRRYNEHARARDRRESRPVECSNRQTRRTSPQRRRVVDGLRERGRIADLPSQPSGNRRHFSHVQSSRVEPLALVSPALDVVRDDLVRASEQQVPENLQDIDINDVHELIDTSWTTPQVATPEESPAPGFSHLGGDFTRRTPLLRAETNVSPLFAATPSRAPEGESSGSDEDTADEMEMRIPQPRRSENSMDVLTEAGRLLTSINAEVARGVLWPEEFTPGVTSTSSTRPARRILAPGSRPQPRAQVEIPPSRSRPALDASSRQQSSKAANKGSNIRFDVAKTVVLPRPEYARARRILRSERDIMDARDPLVWVSMPGDVQFIDSSSRSRIESWSLPAPQRLRSSEERNYVVSDACVLGDSRVIIVHESGPNPVAILTLPEQPEDIPKRYNISNILVPTDGLQRRGGITSVCAVNQSLFVTGGVDKRVLLWKFSKPRTQNAPTSTLKPLNITHSTAVRALAYESQKKWLISAAGSKIAITDLKSEGEIVPAKRQKWASSEVFNIHISEQNRDLILLETGDLDKQVRIYDTRSLQNADNSPLALIGTTETTSISQFLRGDWSNSLIVRPSGGNKVRVWDVRFPSEPLCVHSVPHPVTHTIFTNGGKTIASTGGHMVSFLDAQA